MRGKDPHGLSASYNDPIALIERESMSHTAELSITVRLYAPIIIRIGYYCNPLG